MWLLYRVFILTAFFIQAGEGFAQTPTSPTSQNQMISGAPVAPAPTIEPMLSPQDQAARDARRAAEAAEMLKDQQRTSQPTQIPTQTPPVALPASDSLTVTMPQPVQAPVIQTPIAQTPVAQTPVAQIPAAQAPVLPQPPQQSLQPIIPPPPQPAATPSTSVLTSQTPAETATETPSASTAVETPADNQVQITNAQGFSPVSTGAQIPTTTGMLPVTNPGIDMNLRPNIVGGVDPNAPGVPEIPYEVQLQQRTQELQQQARGIAFDQAKKSVLPLETYEIRDVLGRLKDTQEAIQTPVRPAPRPGNVIRTISTDPSAKPHTIHLAAGNVTTVNIIDITGEPWPIVDIGFGGPFDVKPPEPGGHVIRITPQKDFARGNMVVRLLKLTTPITFSLEAGGKTVDYRFDARMPDYGPNAKMALIDDGIGAVAGDKTTTSFLEGVPPTGAEKITVSGIDGRTSAYRYANALYVRTPLSLLSPAWRGSATSSDGMNVYVLEDTPVLLLSDRGTLVRAHLGQKADSSFKE